MDISLAHQQNTNRLEEDYSECNLAFDAARPRFGSILSLSQTAKNDDSDLVSTWHNLKKKGRFVFPVRKISTE